MDKMQKIYEESPALKNFKGTPQNWNMTRAEIARGALGLMSIAGMQGTMHIMRTALGFNPLPKFNDALPKVDQTKIWDKLDLQDRSALRSYAMESVRLNPPVSSSHYVEQNEIDVTF